MNSSSTRLGLAGREMVIQLFVEVLTRARWNLKSLSVPYQPHDVARSIQDGATMSAVLKVGSHAGAERSIHLAFKIIGNLPPHFYAVDFDGLLRQMFYSLRAYFPGHCQMLSAIHVEQKILRSIRQLQKGDRFARNLICRSKLRPSPPPGATTHLPKPDPQFG